MNTEQQSGTPELDAEEPARPSRVKAYLKNLLAKPENHFAAALVFIGIVQAGVYVGQSIIMHHQMNELVAARKDTEAEQRPVLDIVNPHMFPYDANGRSVENSSPEIAGWYMSPGWKNVGLTRAEHFKFGSVVSQVPINGLPRPQDYSKSCPREPSLNDLPSYPGSMLSPGPENGREAPAERVTMETAQAAQRGRYSIIYVIDADYQEPFANGATHHAYACVWVIVLDAQRSEFSFVIAGEKQD